MSILALLVVVAAVATISLSLLPRVFFLSALVFLSQVPTAFAEYNRWGLVQPVAWKNLDRRGEDSGTVRIDRVTANSRGGSALITFVYSEDEWGWGCQKGESQQFLYGWSFDRDVSSVSGNRGDTIVVATLSLESSRQPAPKCPSLNPYLSIVPDRSEDFASSIGGEARFYAASRDHWIHSPGPRVFRIYNPNWPEAGIRVGLYGPTGKFALDLRIEYIFKAGVSGGPPTTDGSGTQGNTAFCSNYANRAVQQNQQNAARRCGFSGGRWQDNYGNHYNWCLGTNTAAADSEDRARDADLARCAQGAAAQPPGPRPGAGAVLGGVDLLRHCRELYGGAASVRLMDRTVNGWRCVNGSALLSISVEDACRRQYGEPRAIARYRNFNDANTWECVRN